MKTSYVDVAIRVAVTHSMAEDAADLVCQANYEIAGDGIGETEMKECVTVGTKDPDSGALVREDGKTGRNVSLKHDPPLNT